MFWKIFNICEIMKDPHICIFSNVLLHNMNIKMFESTAAQY